MESYLKKNILNSKRSNCLGCLMKPLLNCTLITPIKVTCPHRQGHINKSTFTIDYLKYSLNIICFVPMTIFYYLYFLKIINEDLNLREISSVSSDFVFFIDTFVTVIFNLIKIPIYAIHLNGLSDIIEGGESSYFRSFLDEEFLYRSILFIYVFNATFVAMIIFNLIKTSIASDFSYFELAKTLCFGVCLTEMLSIAAQIIVLIAIYGRISARCYSGIILALTERSRGILSEKLKKSKKLYRSIVNNLEISNNFNVGVYLASWVAGVLMVSIDVFIVTVDVLEEKKFFDCETAFFKVHLCASIFGVWYNLDKVDDLGYGADRAASFLYRYRISTLSVEEAAQVENLITALTIEKPALRASGILTLGTKSIRLIGGTIVTYVLVALQFYVVWKRN